MPFFTNDLSQLLLPTGNLNGSFQIPYWSLIYEVFFYAVFSLSLLGIIKNPRQSILITITVWTALIFYSLFIIKTEIPVASPTISQILFAKQNLYFIAGILLSMSDEQKPYYLLIYGLVLSVVSATPYGAGIRFDLNIMLLGVTMIIAFEKYSQYIPTFLVKIGDWSYGIYLLHLPIVYILYTFLMGRIDNQGQGFLIILSVAFVGSALFGYLDNVIYHNTFNKLASRIYLAIKSKTKM
jgi:peptidoglycan/LPS O-acetylase OafA/YrhL